MFIYMNTAVGAWAGNTTATLSSNFTIDYVRVYNQANAAQSGGQITSKLNVTPGKVNLSQVGTMDWVNWDTTSSADVARENGGNLISTFGVIGPGVFQQSGGSGSTLSWTNGTPQPYGVNPGHGIVSCNAGNGFVLTFPADQQTSVVHLIRECLERAGPAG
jgi:hypothetical protein